jgi:acyl-CoA thioesterase-2
MAAVPASLPELVDLLALDRVGDGVLRGRQPETSLQRVFGGQVAAQALAAAGRTVDDDRSVHSLHAYFLLPGDPAVPIDYHVERVRDGRAFTARRVVAHQHGRAIFFLTASFHVSEDGLDHQDRMPPAGDPESFPTLAQAFERATGKSAESWAREWAALDVRHAGDSRSGGPEDLARPAVAKVWLRAAGTLPDDPLLHACVLAYASDLTLLGSSLVPHGTVIGDPRIQSASLDHAMWFHRPFRADEWLFYDQVSPSASGARAFATGRIFTADGRLVASVVQEGLIRPLAG